jgi:hypothetical protein
MKPANSLSQLMPSMIASTNGEKHDHSLSMEMKTSSPLQKQQDFFSHGGVHHQNGTREPSHTQPLSSLNPAGRFNATLRILRNQPLVYQPSSDNKTVVKKSLGLTPGLSPSMSPSPLPYTSEPSQGKSTLSKTMANPLELYTQYDTQRRKKNIDFAMSTGTTRGSVDMKMAFAHVNLFNKLIENDANDKDVREEDDRTLTNGSKSSTVRRSQTLSLKGPSPKTPSPSFLKKHVSHTSNLLDNGLNVSVATKTPSPHHSFHNSFSFSLLNNSGGPSVSQSSSTGLDHTRSMGQSHLKRKITANELEDDFYGNNGFDVRQFNTNNIPPHSKKKKFDAHVKLSASMPLFPSHASSNMVVNVPTMSVSAFENSLVTNLDLEGERKMTKKSSSRGKPALFHRNTLTWDLSTPFSPVNEDEYKSNKSRSPLIWDSENINNHVVECKRPQTLMPIPGGEDHCLYGSENNTPLPFIIGRSCDSSPESERIIDSTQHHQVGREEHEEKMKSLRERVENDGNEKNEVRMLDYSELFEGDSSGYSDVDGNGERETFEDNKQKEEEKKQNEDVDENNSGGGVDENDDNNEMPPNKVYHAIVGPKLFTLEEEENIGNMDVGQIMKKMDDEGESTVVENNGEDGMTVLLLSPDVVLIDTSPFNMSIDTPLSKAHSLFHLLQV